ncbi:MAG: hypothetical protein AAGF33_18880 [Pseudomonadota bacterium]
MQPHRQIFCAAVYCLLAQACAVGSSAQSASSNAVECSASESPYSDLDFLIGEWEFFTLDGRKIADQIYSRREQGCLLLEDWRTLSGETGTGMNFVDPFTGNWRQVWMSPRFHLDYSGRLIEPGVFVLEGRMYPNDGSGAAEIRGVYTRLEDGSVTKEFLRRATPAEDWQSFFIGVARPKAADHAVDDCRSGKGVFGLFSSLPGAYEYLNGDGEKAGQTTYTSRASGCVILEEFTAVSGETAIGTLMVNPATGLWEHVWRSERFHFEMSGNANNNSGVELEGMLHISGRDAQPIRGAWTFEPGGSVQHTYHIHDRTGSIWVPFFSGTSKPITATQ